ncbi:MAG TPA: DNA mismatch repair endonuclease MutL [Candidatus Binataceae bacterium]|nr:DNA mismatch repair endonuclease MutL [Candidatus Binataceae bacterium]
MAEHIVHILPEQVASQIAAGEVVERPASAVKELIENALDAGAGAISVEIERGGCGLIALADDGCGMTREDAILSLRRHATSKIRGVADLEAIRTLGFRGEALASIASVSHLKMRTRRPADAHGTEIDADGGNIEDARACAMAPGTRIEVRDLFFNTPARLKFLKSAATEQGAIAEIIQRLALSNHEIAFSLHADGRAMLEFPRAKSALERARQVLGPKLADKMLAFERERAGISVTGLVATSQESFATARSIFTFVNGRAVRDRMLTRAIEQAYQTLIPRGRHPAAVVFVEPRIADVDVNVHPMKTEVRFRNSGAIFEAVYHAVRDRLADQTDSGVAAPAPAAIYSPDEKGPVARDAMAVRSPERIDAAPAPQAVVRENRPLRLVPDAPVQAPLNLTRDRDAVAMHPASPPTAPIPLYSQLRMIGQLFAGYIVLEGDDGLLLIDQHAAHERVTFERLRGEVAHGGIRTQAMLTPLTIELDPARAAKVQAALPELRAIGFDVEPFGAATLLLKGAPAVFGAEGGTKLLSDMIDSLSDGNLRPNTASQAGAMEDLLKQLACHGSIRVGRRLSDAEIHALLADLDRTEFKTNCPHGRPVHINFGRGQIERMFRR